MEPLDLKKMEVVTKNGTRKMVPALHIGFAEAKVFITYDVPPPLPLREPESEKGPPQSSAEIEQWLEKMEFLEEDLRWLLKLPHHKFWCQIAFDKQLDFSLRSYLMNAPRFYDLHNFIVNEAMKGSIQRVHKLIFKVYLRMSTYKESKDCHFTPEGFADLIYQYYLFDIPKIMDLCTLYINCNAKILQKMVENIFKVQPCYNDDLDKAAKAMLKAFDTIENKLELRTHDAITTSEPKKLNETSALHSLSWIKWSELLDVIMYLVDVAVSLSSFLEIYPPANVAFHSLNAECRIAAFYDAVFPLLDQELTTRSHNEKLNLVAAEVKKRVNLAKSSFIKIFHNMIYLCCVQPLFELTDVQESGNCVYVEELLHVMSTVVSERSFICKYQKKFPFEDIVDVLSQSNFAPDTAQTDYILSAISASIGSSVSYKVPVKTKKTEKKNLEKLESLLASTEKEPLKNGIVDFVPMEGAAAGPVIQGTELESLITQVQDLLPELGSGFVESCLEYFNYNTEKVINGILEDSLPAALKNLDRKINRSSMNGPVPEQLPPTEPISQPGPSVLRERKNVFDYDEFDVFNSEAIDTSRVYKGKRDDKLESLSEKKDDLQLIKAVCNRYEITSNTYDDLVLYEDEYDDTYDELAMGPEEPPEEDDASKQRPFTIPRVLMTGKEFLEDLEQTTGSESEVHTSGVNEAGSSKEATNQRTYSRTPFDVKGKPKGQGQDAKTMRNRSQKEKHKGSYANHNRRAQADRKRAQGMLHI